MDIAELQRLERSFVKMADRIAHRREAGAGSGWFNPASWEMTALDCREAAVAADHIAEMLKDED
jgi:hypothetical protein